jgi:hypothetical protein
MIEVKNKGGEFNEKKARELVNELARSQPSLAMTKAGQLGIKIKRNEPSKQNKKSKIFSEEDEEYEEYKEDEEEGMETELETNKTIAPREEEVNAAQELNKQIGKVKTQKELDQVIVTARKDPALKRLFAGVWSYTGEPLTNGAQMIMQPFVKAASFAFSKVLGRDIEGELDIVNNDITSINNYLQRLYESKNIVTLNEQISATSDQDLSKYNQSIVKIKKVFFDTIINQKNAGEPYILNPILIKALEKGNELALLNNSNENQLLQKINEIIHSNCYNWNNIVNVILKTYAHPKAKLPENYYNFTMNIVADLKEIVNACILMREQELQSNNALKIFSDAISEEYNKTLVDAIDFVEKNKTNIFGPNANNVTKKWKTATKLILATITTCTAGAMVSYACGYDPIKSAKTGLDFLAKQIIDYTPKKVGDSLKWIGSAASTISGYGKQSMAWIGGKLNFRNNNNQNNDQDESDLNESENNNQDESEQDESANGEVSLLGEKMIPRITNQEILDRTPDYPVSNDAVVGKKPDPFSGLFGSEKKNADK